MKFKIKITCKEYINLMYSLYYRKPVTILLVIWAFVVSVRCLTLCFSNFSEYQMEIIAGLVFGLVILVSTPLRLRYTWKKQFNSNRRLQENMICELTQEKMVLTGDTFNVDAEWNKSFKIQELKNWFLIYESQSMFNMIPKSYMTNEQVILARDIFKHLDKNVKVKLLGKQ